MEQICTCGAQAWRSRLESLWSLGRVGLNPTRGATSARARILIPVNSLCTNIEQSGLFLFSLQILTRIHTLHNQHPKEHLFSPTLEVIMESAVLHRWKSVEDNKPKISRVTQTSESILQAKPANTRP
jgi:hypothetical protein